MPGFCQRAQLLCLLCRDEYALFPKDSMEKLLMIINGCDINNFYFRKEIVTPEWFLLATICLSVYVSCKPSNTRTQVMQLMPGGKVEGGGALALLQISGRPISFMFWLYFIAFLSRFAL